MGVKIAKLGIFVQVWLICGTKISQIQWFCCEFGYFSMCDSTKFGGFIVILADS